MKGRSQNKKEEIQSLREVLEEQLREIFDAEQQSVKAAAGIADGAETPELKRALSNHVKQTQKQLDRLNKAGRILGRDLKGRECPAMRALIQNAGDITDEYAPSALRDLFLIAAQQQIEHFEISAYGMMRGMAESLELDEVAQLLEESLDEEMTEDETLTDIAEDIFSMFAGEEIDLGEEEAEEETDLDEADENDIDEEEKSPGHRR